MSLLNRYRDILHCVILISSKLLMMECFIQFCSQFLNFCMFISVTIHSTDLLEGENREQTTTPIWWKSVFIMQLINWTSLILQKSPLIILIIITSSMIGWKFSLYLRKKQTLYKHKILYLQVLLFYVSSKLHLIIYD